MRTDRCVFRQAVATITDGHAEPWPNGQSTVRPVCPQLQKCRVRFGRWTVIFFFASAASSSAYLTASEIFPLETRALAIAVFYAAGTAIGGIVAPWLFGTLIGTGSRWNVFFGYCGAAVLMLTAAVMELRFGIDAEGRALEDIAEPLSA
jgi:MFS family permease